MSQSKNIPGSEDNTSSTIGSIREEDGCVMTHDQNQFYSANYAKLPLIAEEVYLRYADEISDIECIITREEISYYATALLWLRLLDIKEKQQIKALSFEEFSIRFGAKELVLNIPLPIFEYLHKIKSRMNIMGNEYFLSVPRLPIAGSSIEGYHADRISTENHNLFEEVPSLGVAGDMVMALAAESDKPEPKFNFEIPEYAEITGNLTGRFYPNGPIRTEIKQRLWDTGITEHLFCEYVKGTRFSLRYIMQLSDILGKLDTGIEWEKVEMGCFSCSEGAAQLIKTKVSKIDFHVTVPCEKCKHLVLSMNKDRLYGFDAYKVEAKFGANITQKSAKWCCLTGLGDDDCDENWSIPQAWIENRNDRRKFKNTYD